MPTSKVALLNVRTLFMDYYTHTGVKNLVRWIMDNHALSQFELSKRSGLSPAAIFQILKKTERQVSRPPRRSTVVALARVVGADVTFDGRNNRFHLMQTFDLTKTPRGAETSIFLSQLAGILMEKLRKTGRMTFTREEKVRILGVVKALVA